MTTDEGRESPAPGLGLDSVNPGEDSLDGASDGDRQLSTDSDALDTGLNDSDLGADVAGDIGPKHG